MNMVFLPSNADTFVVMPAFRAALGVECNFCHVFGDRLERGHADERHLDDNPKKRIARSMIGMLKEINTTLFPQENIDVVFAASSIVPDGKHYVTCVTLAIAVTICPSASRLRCRQEAIRGSESGHAPQPPRAYRARARLAGRWTLGGAREHDGDCK